MSVVLSVAEVGPCRRQVKIEVPEPEVEAETRRVVGALARRVQVPGFRKGKVPARILRQRYREDIEQQVLDRLLPRVWRQAEAETGLDPLLPPRVSDVEMEEGAPLTFTAFVEVRPEISLGNIRDFDLPDVDVEPTGEEVSAALEEVRRAWASWHPVERPAAAGHLVEAHITELDAGTAGEVGGAAGQPRPVRFEVAHPDVWEELTAAVTGQVAGEVVEFSRGEPEPQGGAPAARRRFRVAIDAVREVELPPLDDALAQRVGRFEDLPALRRDVEEQIRRRKLREARRRREGAMLDQLCRRHPVDLPEWVVEQEIENRLSEYAEEMARQGMDPERANLDWNALAAEARPTAERSVHARLLLDAVAAAESVEVSDGEVEAVLADLARRNRQTVPALRRQLAEAGKLPALRTQLRREKTARLLIGEPAGDEAPAAGGGA